MSKTIEKFESAYDGDGPTRRLKTGSIPADLVAFESLGIGKLPPVIARALNSYVYGWTEIQPITSARLAHTEKALVAVAKEQREADALSISAILSRGPEGFSGLVTALDSVDLVAQAEANHNLARRIAAATIAANKGQFVYISTLVGGEYRTKMLEILDKAWRNHVVLTTTDRTTLGELKKLEGIATEGRVIIGRLLGWVESSHRGRGFNAAELKLVRSAIKDEEWDELPTLERIQQRAAQDKAATSEGQAAAEAGEHARQTKVEADEANKRYATQAAQARHGIQQQNEKSDKPSTKRN